MHTLGARAKRGDRAAMTPMSDRLWRNQDGWMSTSTSDEVNSKMREAFGSPRGRGPCQAGEKNACPDVQS